MSSPADSSVGRAENLAGTDAGWQPHIVALVCNWCSYAGADMAGTTRLSYPANVRLLRLPCTGRMSPLLILRAFELGADGVLVSGCHPGDCHYVQGNLVARRRFTVFRSLMEFVGLDLRRLHFAWVSAAEGHKWAQVVNEVTTAVREVGPLPGWGRSLEPSRSTPLELPRPEPARRASWSAAEGEDLGERLREVARNLLREGRVELVIGYSAGSLPGQMVPAFVTEPEQAESLVWNAGCFTDLAVYLPSALRRARRVAVMVRACDMKAAVGLLQEHQVERESCVLIGVACAGLEEDGSPLLKCHACSGEVPEGCDLSVTPEGASDAPGPGEGAAIAPDPRDAQIEFLEALSPEERWSYWQGQFARCLRCYACRAVCPLCYCESCISEKHQPQWISTAIDGPGNTAWNVVRAYHLGGRCAGCDECARVCPANIRLDLLNRKLALEVERRFGYRPGEDASVPAAMATFLMDDREEFIR